jgi:TIR domain
VSEIRHPFVVDTCRPSANHGLLRVPLHSIELSMPNDNLESDAALGVPRQEHFVDGHPLTDQPAIEQSAVRRRYDAFISYSHAADRSLSRPVQRCLETLAKPLYQRKALWIFRDEPSLAATSGLWPTIQLAMESSRYFVLLASPDAARSPWVRRELTWWMRNREPHTLLIALTAGTIAWDPAIGATVASTEVVYDGPVDGRVVR